MFDEGFDFIYILYVILEANFSSKYQMHPNNKNYP